MIVIYAKPNALHLPYYVIIKAQKLDKNNKPVIDDKGEPKFIDKRITEYHTFIPGKNYLSKEKWLSIVEYNKDDMDHYLSILKPFKPTIDKESQVEIGIDENKIDFSKLRTKDMVELVENTMALEDLDKYLTMEKKRDKPRTAVKRAIKDQIVLVNEAEVALDKN